MDKPITETRVDTFVSQGLYNRVLGRTDHEISTDLQITRSFTGNFYKFVHDDVYDEYGAGDDEYRPAHIPFFYRTEVLPGNPDGIRLPLDNLTVNQSVGSLEFRPVPSQNSLNVSPKDSLHLLPYLCEDGIKEQAIYRVESDSVILTDVDHTGAPVVPVDNTRTYAYHPVERGMFFSQIIRDQLEDDEKVFESCNPQSDVYQAGNDDPQRIVSRAQQATLNANGAIPGAGAQAVLRRGLPMVEKRKVIDGVIRKVYRTEFENYVVQVRGKNFLTGAGGANEMRDITGYFAFLFQYNLEIGPFDASGYSECRAVSFNGSEDITAEVLNDEGFFKMVLWEPGEIPVRNTVNVIMNDGGGAAVAGVATAINVGLLAGIRQVVLYLPQRRFAITHRDPAITNVLNDAQIRSPLVNTVFTHFATRSNEYFATRENETSPGIGCAVRAQYDLLRYTDRDENDETAAANFYSQHPRTQFGMTGVNRNPLPLRERGLDMTADEMGIFEPVFVFAGDNNNLNVQDRTRKLIGFRVLETTEIGKQLAFCRGLADGILPQDEIIMFDMLRTYSPGVKPAAPTALNNHAFAEVAYAFPAQHALQRVHFLLVKAAIAVGGGYVTVTGPNCKYIYNAERYPTAAKTQAVNLMANAAATLAFANFSNIFSHIGNPKIKHFYKFDDRASLNFGHIGGIGALDTTRHLPLLPKSGIIRPIGDIFFDHDAAARVQPNGAYTLHPQEQWREVRTHVNTGWNARYAAQGLVATVQSKYLYDELATLNPIRAAQEQVIAPLAQPLLAGVPWAVPAGFDPDDHASYATFPRVAGFNAINAAYTEIQARNHEPLYYNIRNTLVGVGSLRYIREADFFAEENRPILRSRFTDLEITEPLLTFGGMSQFQPHKIMPIIHKFPGLIQDIEFRAKDSQVVKYRDIYTFPEDVTLELEPAEGYSLQTYSQNSFKQELKGLYPRLDVLHPKFVKFQGTFDSTAEKKVEFHSEHGPPDYVFIRVERISKAGEIFDKYPPIVNHLKLVMFQQNVETVSQLNAVQLYQATRRNSNFRCDSIENRDEIGAVLLSRLDFGEWARFQDFEMVDVFQGEFQIEVTSRAPTQPALSVEETARVAAQQHRVDIIFIFEHHALQGSIHDLHFWFK